MLNDGAHGWIALQIRSIQIGTGLSKCLVSSSDNNIDVAFAGSRAFGV